MLKNVKKGLKFHNQANLIANTFYATVLCN